MKPEIKAKWIAALRSGEYQQAHGVLRRHDAFCCLGVLCDLYAKEADHDAEWNDDQQFVCRPDNGAAAYIESAALPAPVRLWAGVERSNPSAGESSLAEWNDGCMGKRESMPFSNIADLIEQYL